MTSFFALTGEPLGGALISANNGNYLYAQMWCGSSLILGGLILIFARVKKTGFVLKARI